MHEFWLLVAFIIRLLADVTGLAGLSIADAYLATMIPAPAGARVVVGIDDEYIVASGPADSWSDRRLTRVLKSGEEELLLTLPEEWSWCGPASEQLLPRDNGKWWYSRCAGGRQGLIIRVIDSDAPSRPGLMSVNRRPGAARGWLPMEGEQIEGVFLSVIDAGERNLRADLVTPSGSREIAVFERNDLAVILPRTWQAFRLDEDRIAILSVEFDLLNDTSMILLRVISEEGVKESRLAFGRDFYLSVAGTVDRTGKLAVVAATRRFVHAMIIDPADPSAGRERVLAREEVTDALSAGVRVVANDDRFVAIWLHPSNHVVRMAEFGPRFTFPPVSIGDETGGSESLLALASHPEGIDVIWTAGDKLARRQLPQHPTGFVVAAEAWSCLRQYFDRILLKSKSCSRATRSLER